MILRRTGEGAAQQCLLTNVGFCPGDAAAWLAEKTEEIPICCGAWHQAQAVREFPVLGEVAAPVAVLIRPDGYVAWAGGPPHPGLNGALTTWSGPPAEA